MAMSTGMFLASDSEGNASLNRFDEQHKQVQTCRFYFLPHLADLKICRKVETHTLGVGNNNDSKQFEIRLSQVTPRVNKSAGLSLLAQYCQHSGSHVD